MTVTLQAVYPDGTAALSAAEEKRTVDLPRCALTYTARLTGGQPSAVRVLADGDEIYSAGVDGDSCGALGAEMSAALCAQIGGCADGGEKLARVLLGTGSAVFGLECETADGTRTTLGASAGENVTLTADLPENARTVILTADGQPCAVVQTDCTESEETENATCVYPGIARTSVLWTAEHAGAETRIVPAVLSSVRTFPPLPPALRLRAFGKALVASGAGRVAVIVGGNTLTERAVKDAVSVWAAEDGTLAYSSGGTARMCRGTADICSAEGDAVVVTGSGDGAVMHVLGGGRITGVNAYGTVYSRITSALAVCAYLGNVAELHSDRTELYSPSGAHIRTRTFSHGALTAVHASPAGFGVTAETDGMKRYALITPSVSRVLTGGLPSGYDGMLAAYALGDGRTGIYDVSGADAELVGYADSGEFAFTDALYSVADGGKITRRAVLRTRALLTGDGFVSGGTYEIAGSVMTRAASAATVTAEGG